MNAGRESESEFHNQLPVTLSEELSAPASDLFPELQHNPGEVLDAVQPTSSYRHLLPPRPLTPALASEQTSLTPELGYPSFRDNHFDTRDLINPLPRTPSPQVVVSGEDGQEYHPNDTQIRPNPKPGSDSDASEPLSFKSIKTVEDCGFARYHPKSQSTVSQAGEAETTAQDLSQGLSAASQHDSDPKVLQNMGSLFETNQGEASPSKEDFDTALDVDNIRDNLCRAYTQSEFNNNDDELFVPLNALCSNISKKNVLCLLRNTFPGATAEEIEGYVEGICGPKLPGTGRRCIFAILVLIDKCESMLDFIKAKVFDIHLPLQVKWNTGTRVHELFNIKDDESLRSPLLFGKPWKSNDFNSFKANQSYMLAPFFWLSGEHVFYYKIPSQNILPFVEYGQETNGGYGTIYKVRIHKAHHSFRRSKVSSTV